MTTNTDNTKTSTCLTSKPKLLLKPTSKKPITTTTTSVLFPTSPIASGVFYLPIQQKPNRKGGRHPPKKHLRKPPSFDTYIPSSNSTSATGYLRSRRAPSVSSSYSSTSSIMDNEDTSEDMLIYGYGSQRCASVSSTSVNRHHRRPSSAFKVRFAETSDDGSSIVSSSSGGSVDEWDDMEEEEEEEEYIFIARQASSQHYYNYHNKSDST